MSDVLGQLALLAILTIPLVLVHFSGVWGERVNVPPGTVPINPGITWANANPNDNGSEPTGDEPTGDEPTGDDGDGKQGDNTLDSREETVAKRELEVAQKEAFMEGYLRAQAEKAAAAGDESKEGDEKEEETPLFEKIEFDADRHVEENEKLIASRYNSLVDEFVAQKTAYETKIGDLEKKFDGLQDTVSQQVFDQNIAVTTATTGVTKEEILSKYNETKIANTDILAQLVLGEKAIKGEELPNKKAEEAEAERQENTGAISGTTHGGTEQVDDLNKPYRGLDPNTITLSEKTNGDALAAIASKYKFRPILTQSGVQ